MLVGTHATLTHPKSPRSLVHQKCYHTRSISDLIRAGWCHSVFVFITSYLHLLISTPSATCLLWQSLKFPITFALKSAGCSGWKCVWCLSMNESVFLPSYLFRCSFPLVNRFLLVSPIYTDFPSCGHILKSIE